jgi:hypothetical protein
MTPIFKTPAAPHPLKKFLWPAVVVLMMGLLVIAFLTGALFGKTTGETKTNGAWYNSTRGALQVMRDLDAAGKKEALSSMIQKMDTRLKLAAPEEGAAIVSDAAKGFAQ